MEKNLPRTVDGNKRGFQTGPRGSLLKYSWRASVFHDPLMILLPEIPKASHVAFLEEETQVEHPETFPGVPQRLGREKYLTGSLGEAHSAQCG